LLQRSFLFYAEQSHFLRGHSLSFTAAAIVITGEVHNIYSSAHRHPLRRPMLISLSDAFTCYSDKLGELDQRRWGLFYRWSLQFMWPPTCPTMSIGRIPCSRRPGDVASGRTVAFGEPLAGQGRGRSAASIGAHLVSTAVPSGRAGRERGAASWRWASSSRCSAGELAAIVSLSSGLPPPHAPPWIVLALGG